MTAHPPTNCHHVIKGVYEYTTYPPYSSLRHHRCFEITNKKKQLHFNLLNKTKKTWTFSFCGIGQITKQKTFEVLLYVGNKRKHSPGKKNKGENKAFKKKQTKKRTFTSFSRMKVFFLTETLQWQLFFLFVPNIILLFTRRKHSLLCFLVLHFCWNKKKHQQKKFFFVYLFFFLFFVLFLKLVFVNPVSTQQPFLVSDLNFLVETKTAWKKFSSWQTRKARVFLLFWTQKQTK